MKKWYIFPLLCVIGISLYINTQHSQYKNYTPISNIGIEVYDVLLNGAGGGDENLKRKDCLRDCPSIIQHLRFEDEIYDTDLEVIDYYMDLYYSNGFLPRDPYAPVPGGEYVTSMDAPLLGVTCQLAYEKTGNEKYHKFVYDLIPYLVTNTDDGGYILYESEDCWWPLEYAWNGVSTSDAWYVYNGSLFGTLCTELLYICTNDERLGGALNKFENSYKKHSEEFFYSNKEWCYYSLNYTNGMPIINMTEKLLIEIRALNGLYVLTEDTFWQDEYNRRIELFAGLYPVYKLFYGGQSYVYFLRSGAPHPYYVDIYPTTIELYDEDWQLTETIEAGDRFVVNSYVKERISSKSKFYKLYAEINGIEKTLLVVDELKSVDLQESEAINNGEYSFWGDCSMYNDGTLKIKQSESDLLKAIWQIDLPYSFECTKEAYWVVDLDNCSNENFPIQVVLTDSEGQSVSRYLQNVVYGHNSLIFSYLGFRDATSIKNVNSVRIEFITNNMVEEESTIVINSIYYCPSPVSLIEYLSNVSINYNDYWCYKTE